MRKSWKIIAGLYFFVLIYWYISLGNDEQRTIQLQDSYRWHASASEMYADSAQNAGKRGDYVRCIKYIDTMKRHQTKADSIIKLYFNEIN